jgi:hypothetical protein
MTYLKNGLLPQHEEWISKIQIIPNWVEKLYKIWCVGGYILYWACGGKTTTTTKLSSTEMHVFPFRYFKNFMKS